MVNVSDKFYGIGHQNKISNVHKLTKQDALDFIADIMAEEESVENQESSKSRAAKSSAPWVPSWTKPALVILVGEP